MMQAPFHDCLVRSKPAHRWQEDAADDSCVDQDGGGGADGHPFISRIGSVAKIENAPTITTAALVTVPAVVLIPCTTASSVESPRSNASRCG